MEPCKTDANDKREGGAFLRLPAFFVNGSRGVFSPEAAIVYSLLLNRARLSRDNGWIDENGVYVYFRRSEIAAGLGTGRKKVTAAIRELKERGLLKEKRMGNCLPNRLYPLYPEEETEAAEKRPAATGRNGASGGADVCRPRGAETAPPIIGMRNKETIKKESTGAREARPDEMFVKERENGDGETDENGAGDAAYAETAVSGCSPERYGRAAADIEAAVTEPCRARGGARAGEKALPESEIRRLLSVLTPDICARVAEKTKRYSGRIRNPVAYFTAALMNVLRENSVAPPGETSAPGGDIYDRYPDLLMDQVP